MPDLVVLMGIPGSGKSSFVQEQLEVCDSMDWDRPVVVSTDKIRLELTGDAENQTRNGEVFRLAHHRTVTALLLGYDVMFDATNVTASARKDLLDIAKDAEADTTLMVLRVPFEECLRRNGDRDRVVPLDIMVKMLVKYTESLHAIGTEAWNNIIFIES